MKGLPPPSIMILVILRVLLLGIYLKFRIFFQRQRLKESRTYQINSIFINYNFKNKIKRFYFHIFK